MKPNTILTSRNSEYGIWLWRRAVSDSVVAGTELTVKRNGHSPGGVLNQTNCFTTT